MALYSLPVVLTKFMSFSHEALRPTAANADQGARAKKIPGSSQMLRRFGGAGKLSRDQWLYAYDTTVGFSSRKRIFEALDAFRRQKPLNWTHANYADRLVWNVRRSRGGQSCLRRRRPVSLVLEDRVFTLFCIKTKQNGPRSNLEG